MKMNAVEFVDAVVMRARVMCASDIHIDPFPAATTVRFRVDGLLKNICTIPPPLHAEVIARIKILAGLRIDIHQTPQDGRFRIDQGDVRVSVVPTHYGENSVLRILSRRAETEGDKDKEKIDGFIDLGFSPGDIENIETALKRRKGLILITGPTGSGKTTTLYALLRKLNTGVSSIVTLEDPVEYSLDGVRQIQVDHKYGMTFVTGLRAILRQDPDIIMVGEIRDSETAKIAVHSALTGHMVISTLHTDSAPAAIPRLLDMGVDPYLISATLCLVVGQRLGRLLCRICAGNESSLCKICSRSGYKGRIGIYETLPVSDELRAAIVGRIPFGKTGISMRTMHEDGMEKVARGITTREELARILYE